MNIEQLIRDTPRFTLEPMAIDGKLYLVVKSEALNLPPALAEIKADALRQFAIHAVDALIEAKRIIKDQDDEIYGLKDNTEHECWDTEAGLESEIEQLERQISTLEFQIEVYKEAAQS